MFLQPTSIIYFLSCFGDIRQFSSAQAIMQFEKEVNHAMGWRQGRVVLVMRFLFTITWLQPPSVVHSKY